MMFIRMKDQNQGSFGIPASLISPDTVSTEEAEALQKAGFEWHADEDSYSGYVMEIGE